MAIVLRKPVVIAAIVAAISMAAIFLVDHTNLIVDRQPAKSPPGTTFNTANDAGATVSPTLPESPIKPTPPGPAPVQPAIPAK